MKLSIILIFYFIITAILGSVGGSYYYYVQSNYILEAEVINHLESVAQSTENFINLFLEEQKEKVEIAATHEELSIEELKELETINDNLYEVFVLDSNGIIVASSDETKIGLNRGDDAYFVNARTETYIKPSYFSEETQTHAIAVSTPFHEGVLVVRIELGVFNLIVADKTGLGETGESLLGYEDENGGQVVFTERRFDEQVESLDVVFSMDKALNEIEDVFLDSRDCRDEKVIAVTRYIEEVEFGLVTKIDEAEAFGVVRNQLIKTASIIVVLIIVVFSLIGFFVAQFISRPLRKISKEVDEITKGKLDIQLGKSSIFEVQKLIDSLNRILASLKLAILKTGSAEGLGIGEVVEAKERAEKKMELFKIFIDSSKQGMGMADINGKIIYANPTLEKLVEDRMIGKNLKEYYSKNSGDKLKKILVEVIKKDHWNGELNLISKKGKIIKVIQNVFVIKDNQGKPIYFANVIVRING